MQQQSNLPPKRSRAEQLNLNREKGLRAEQQCKKEGLISGKKEHVKINGRSRFPDGDNMAGLVEVKNVNNLSNTSQLNDYLAHCKAMGKKLTLIVDSEAELSKPLKELIKEGKIILIKRNFNKPNGPA